MAILSDFRYPGGTSASIAEEIEAQHAAGLSTVLVHVPASHLRTVSAFHPRIASAIRRGIARLALAGDDVAARLLVMRHPRVLETEPDPVPSIRADRAVMVVNQPPRDHGHERAYYDLDEIRARVERMFGPTEWAPIGPLVRRSVVEESPHVPLTESDWVNVIDVEQWRVDRTAGPHDPIVVGRFSRPDARKWPTTTTELLAAYPEADDVRVRVLGGGEKAVDQLGRVPRNWELLPFGSVDPREFVRDIDVFVYFHAPTLVEAFGRTTLEAMASGAPAILPATFRPLFGDSAIYATPAEVAGIVRRLRDDPAEYQRWSRSAVDFVEQHFGHQVHVDRVTARLGDRDVPAPRRSPTVPRPPVTPPFERVMMLSSNGGGLGHVTRLMAIARRLPESLRAVVATQSQAAPLVLEQGHPTEYVPSRGHLQIPVDRWNELLRERLEHLVDTYRPRLVLVDGTVPYGGLLEAMGRHPEITWVWLRRAMWKPGLGGEWIRRGRAFDAVIEPGDHAEDADAGLTVAERGEVRRVDPITYLDPDELSPAHEAREALGLPSTGTVALLQLGAGNINDIQSPVGGLAAHLLDAGVHVVVARSPIATRELDVPDGVQVISYYPLSRHLRGFDFTISAGGYNSFHESIGFAVPTVFVPNPDTALDDQEARVAEAVRTGLALSIPDLRHADAAMDAILDPEVREELTAQCRRVHRPNGAVAAAAHVAELAQHHGGGAAR